MNPNEVVENFPFDAVKFWLWPKYFGWHWSINFVVIIIFGFLVTAAAIDNHLEYRKKMKWFAIGISITTIVCYLVITFFVSLLDHYNHELTKEWGNDYLKPYIENLPEKRVKVLAYDNNYISLRET